MLRKIQFTKTLFTVMILGGCMSTAAAQQPVWARCEGCVAGTLVQEMAPALMAGTRLVIYDRHASWVQAFDIIQQVVGGPQCHERAPAQGKEVGRFGCSLETVGVATSLTGLEQDLAVALFAVHQATAGEMKALVYLTSAEAGAGPGPVTGDTSGSALDIANNGLYAAEFRDRVTAVVQAGLQGAAGGAPMGNAFAQLSRALRDLANVHLLGDEVKIIIVVTFQDGSSARLEGRLDQPDLEIKELRDAHGRLPISPFTPPSAYFEGHAVYQDTNAQENWLEAARRNGVEIVDGYGGAPHSVSCRFVRNDNGWELICHRN